MINKSLGFNILIEHKKGHGQDGEPVLVHGKESVGLAVFDGVGGSSAYGDVGAEIVSNYTKTFLNAHKDALLHKQQMLEFEKVALSRLRERAKTLERTGSRSKCATTIALANVVNQKDGSYLAQLSWAGDSRVYFLSPSKGLQLLTLDDSWKAIQTLGTGEFNTAARGKNKEIKISERPKRSTIPISEVNRIFDVFTGYTLADQYKWDKRDGNAEKGFYQINFKEEIFDEPGVFILCTDGGYKEEETPLQMEKVYLRLLAESSTEEEFEDQFHNYLKTHHRHDDVSFAVQSVGFPDYAEMKDAFQRRRQDLYEQIAACGGETMFLEKQYASTFMERMFRNEVLHEEPEPHRETDKTPGMQRKPHSYPWLRRSVSLYR